MKRLAKMLIGAILAAFALVIPAAPANADDDYMIELTIDDDLNVREIMNVTIPEESFELMGNSDFCEQLENLAKVRMADAPGISNPELGNCEQHENNISFEITGKVKEDFTSGEGWKVTDEEIVYSIPREVGMSSGLIDSTEGGVKITFPGKIKSVDPDIGTISGNSWSIDNAGNIDNQVTITAERHSSSSGLILGIAIPAALIIVAVIVLLIVRNSRKKKQPNLPPYQAGYGAYPPPPFMPGNSPNPAQPQVPGYPASGTPGAPGTPSKPPYQSESEPPLPGATGTFPGHQPPAGNPPTPGNQSPLPSAAGIPGVQPPKPESARISAQQPPMPGGAKSPISGAPTPGGYPPPYGGFPAPPAMPGNPAQASTPGYPASGTPGMPGGASYPPNVPPQTQAGVPISGGNYPSPYPYPYPYPPANPQNPGGGQPPIPNQANGAPSPGFQPPAADPQPGESEKPDDPNQAAGFSSGKHVANSPQPGQSD